MPDEKLNPNGGAVAIGHPFGSSGTRYVLTLATELRERKARYGVAGVCVGSGQGVALVLENPRAGVGDVLSTPRVVVAVARLQSTDAMSAPVQSSSARTNRASVKRPFGWFSSVSI